VTAPLRIGLLGAARIADDGIVTPARTLGHELVAVAARDRNRAEWVCLTNGVVAGMTVSISPLHVITR
jgi:predicted dehydrogenase